MLTPKQKRIFDYVADRVKANKLPPTQEEIANKFGYRAISSINEHLQNLVNRGYLVHFKYKACGYTLPKINFALIKDEILKTKLPIESIENIMDDLEDSIDFEKRKLI